MRILVNAFLCSPFTGFFVLCLFTLDLCKRLCCSFASDLFLYFFFLSFFLFSLTFHSEHHLSSVVSLPFRPMITSEFFHRKFFPLRVERLVQILLFEIWKVCVELPCMFVRQNCGIISRAESAAVLARKGKKMETAKTSTRNWKRCSLSFDAFHLQTVIQNSRR